MNNRERFIASVRGEAGERVALWPGNARKQTRDAWRKQGLMDADHWEAELAGLIGLDKSCLQSVCYPPIDLELRPRFEEKVLERRARTQIVQDIHGNVVEISNDFDVTMLRNPVGFVTRRWVRCPVAARDDWERMKARYRWDDPGRVTDAGLKKWDEYRRQGDAMVKVWFNGLFMQMREWMGFEPLCLAFYDDEEMIDDMIAFYGEFISRMLERALPRMRPDCVHVGEDIAYKGALMIAPEIIRQKLVPVWRQWGEIVHGSGCPVYMMDSDGFVGTLVPLLIEAGFDINDPLEVAAGNDIIKLQEEFGDRIAFMGGVDKRVMARGGDELRDFMEYIRPAVRRGRYIPSCDHGIPDDVSWPRMIEYARLLAEITGWGAR